MEFMQPPFEWNNGGEKFRVGYSFLVLLLKFYPLPKAFGLQ